MSWSSGKDSAWALHHLRSTGELNVVGLLTTLNGPAERVAMHAVREILLDRQAAVLGLPLIKIYLPSPCSNEEYEAAMADTMSRAEADGVTAVAFGDLYLEDVRRYREEKLAATALEAHFPLWGADTAALSREMVRAGLRAHVTCVDPAQLDPALVGRTYDDQFLDDLADFSEFGTAIDPCGENGEFHTFVHAGPMFPTPIPIVPGEVVRRDGFVFADVVLGTS